MDLNRCFTSYLLGRADFCNDTGSRYLLRRYMHRRTETAPPPPTAEQFLLGGKKKEKKYLKGERGTCLASG